MSKRELAPETPRLIAAPTALAGAVLYLYLVTTAFGDAFLPVWPDEVLFCRQAQNLADGKGMGIDLLDGFWVGIKERTYACPPLYPIALAGWGKVFGFSVESVRIFSRLLGVGGVVLVYSLALQICGRPWVAVLCAWWVAADLLFLRASNLGRMDILCIDLILLALLCYARCLSKAGRLGSWNALEPSSLQAFKPSSLEFALAGFFSALAALTHPLGTGALVSITAHFLLFTRRPLAGLGAYWLAAVLALSLWGIYIAQDVSTFMAQMEAQWLRKQAHREPTLAGLFLRPFSWYFPRPYSFGVRALCVVPLAILCGTVLTLTFSERFRDLRARLLGISLMVMFVSAAYGKESHYPPYFMPIFYLSLGCLAGWFLERGSGWRRLAVWGSALLLVVNITSNALCWQLKVRPVRSLYADFGQEVSRWVRPNDVVLLSCIPDPYFALVTRHPKVRYYEFAPPFTAGSERYEAVMKKVTCVIMGEPRPKNPAGGDPVFRRIVGSRKEKEVHVRVKSPNGGFFSATVVRLRQQSVGGASSPVSARRRMRRLRGENLEEDARARRQG